MINIKYLLLRLTLKIIAVPLVAFLFWFILVATP